MRRLLLALLMSATVAGLASPGLAAPGTTTTDTVAYRDPTPDPTGMAVGSDGHCSGLLPAEAPYVFTAPARGTLKVTLGGFEGEWALHLEDPKGSVLAETDTTGAYESLTVKVKKAGDVHVQPCNLFGTPDGLITLQFTVS